MNVWLILWCILAGALIVFSVWTFIILMRQKRGWRVYAEKRKLRYDAKALMDSPSVDGVIGEHSISCFASEHSMQDARTIRKLTAIEIKLNSIMPVGGCIASGGMIPVMNTLNLKQEYVPDHEAWDKAYVAAADNRAVLQAYMTDARVEALCALMEVEHSWIIFVFKDDAMLLRIDVAQPLARAKELDEMVKKMLATAEILELVKGESKRIEKAEIAVAAQSFELEVDGEALDADSGLALEEDASVEDVETPKEKDAKDDKSSASPEKSKKKK